MSSNFVMNCYQATINIAIRYKAVALLLLLKLYLKSMEMSQSDSNKISTLFTTQFYLMYLSKNEEKYQK